MSFLQTPSKWNSVFRPVVYQHEYSTAYFSSVTSVGGFARFDLTLTTSLTGIRRIYISGGTYSGWHTISAVTATTITTETAFISTTTGYAVIIEDTQFEIYVGYPSGTYAVENPERLIATIQPAPNLTGQLYFDIAEYLKAAWANDGYAPMVAPPANGVDVNMSTPFRVATLGRSASDGSYYYAAYATITTGDLNEFDLSGVFLSVDEPVVFSCGCTILSQILDTVIYNQITCSGVTYTDEVYFYQDDEIFEFMDGETYIFN
jgi:hypothetical protein